MHEKATLHPSPRNPTWTEFVQHGTVAVTGLGSLGRLVEMFAHTFLSQGAKRDYQVLQLLGKGAFACVYRARSVGSLIEVAIKMIDKKAMKKAGMLKRVRNEVEIHCQLKHPSVLELYTCFEDQNYVYLVLEMCHKGEVGRYLKAKGGTPFSEEQVRHFMKQTVHGMLYLHSHGILHRDLTLSNLLLTADMNIKIADFGLAAQLRLPEEKHFTMCGTPNYISPEIATRGAHGLESDVWSLGCMLYTMLVGRPPFDTDAIGTTLNRVVLGEYSEPMHLSKPARSLIHQLLQKNPVDRLGLACVLDHPFMTLRGGGSRMTTERGVIRSHPMPSQGVEVSMDSGNTTMSTAAVTVERSRSGARLVSGSRETSTQASKSATSFGFDDAFHSTCTSGLGGVEGSACRSETSCRSERDRNGDHSTRTGSRPGHTNARSTNSGISTNMRRGTDDRRAKTDAQCPSHTGAREPGITASTESQRCAQKFVQHGLGSARAGTAPRAETEQPSGSRHDERANVCGSLVGRNTSSSHSALCTRECHQSLMSDRVDGDRLWSNNACLDLGRIADKALCEQHSSQCGCQGRDVAGEAHGPRGGCQTTAASRDHGEDGREGRREGVAPALPSHSGRPFTVASCGSGGGTGDGGDALQGTNRSSVFVGCAATPLSGTAGSRGGCGVASQPHCNGATDPRHYPPARGLIQKQADGRCGQGVERRADTQETQAHWPSDDVMPKDGSAGRNVISHVTSLLNSIRLRPIRQLTKNAVVSVLEDGEVCLEFLKGRSGRERVREVLRISSDGQQIRLYQPNEGRGFPLDDRPSSPPEEVVIYSYHTLPETYWKKYKYAARFVQLVRSKTPKVTLYTQHAKCTLMENSPQPDFEACFYDGAKVHRGGEASMRVIEPSGRLSVLDGSVAMDGVGAAEGVRTYLCHAEQVYRQCVALEALISAQEDKCHPSIGLFPITVSRRPLYIVNPLPAESASPATQEGVTRMVQPPSPSQAPALTPSMLLFDGKAMSEASSPVSLGGSSACGRAEVVRSVFVPLVGWASQLASGEVWVHFNEGCRMQVHPTAASIAFTDSLGVTSRFSQKDQFPEQLKDRLQILPRVVELLATSGLGAGATSTTHHTAGNTGSGIPPGSRATGRTRGRCGGHRL
ncbi:serine/threonine-protein kinase PLK4-like isoform X3 [Lampetra planeri]